MSTTSDTDLLDPEKMREAIAAVRYNQHMDSMHQPQSLGVVALAQQAAFAREIALDELHALNRRLLAAKVAWAKRQPLLDMPRGQTTDEIVALVVSTADEAGAEHDGILESERLLHEAFEALEAKRDDA